MPRSRQRQSLRGAKKERTINAAHQIFSAITKLLERAGGVRLLAGIVAAALRDGTIAAAFIVVESRRPIESIFPAMRRFLAPG